MNKKEAVHISMFLYVHKEAKTIPCIYNNKFDLKYLFLSKSSDS